MNEKKSILNRMICLIFFGILLLWWAGPIFGDCDPDPCNHNVSITNWDLDLGDVQSPDIRINTPGPDYFLASAAQDVQLIKTGNTIYVRFTNNSINFIADGGVTVTASYASTDTGLLADDLEALNLNGLTWQNIGSYTMNMVLPVGGTAGVDDNLFPGDTYPTVNEVGDPTRYRIACSFNCTTPMPIAFILKVSVQLAAVTDDDPGDNIAYSYYDLSGGTPRVDVVLVQDCSGSMIDELPLALDRAQMLVDLMNTNDRVGAVAFSDCYGDKAHPIVALTQIPSPASDPTNTIRNSIKSTLGALTIGSASCMTPMGQGVIEARSMLLLPPEVLHAENQAIVLLTDGKENVGPMVNQAPFTILNSLDSAGIALYPLWFGAASDWGKELLENIAAEVDEYKLVDQPEDDLELAKAYLMIRGILTSDDVFDIHRGLADDGYTSAVQVDDVTKELILAVAWQDMKKKLSIEVSAPGGGGWQDAGALTSTVFTGNAHAVYRFANPDPGEWQYRLKTSSREKNYPGERNYPNERNYPGKEPYVISALADKVEVVMSSNLEDNALRAGETLTLYAKLVRQAIPVRNAEVTAKITIPQNSLGTLLQKVRDKIKNINGTPGTDISRGDMIAKELPKILGKTNVIDYKTVSVSLHDDGKDGDLLAGDGIYSARVTETNVAGTYGIKIFAQNNPSSTLKFRREHEHAAIVNIGEIDPAKSIVDMILDRVDNGYNIWKIMAVPIDTRGNSSYPGYASKLTFSASSGVWLGNVVDNEDGSYYRLLRQKQGERANVTVTAYGKTLPAINTGKVAKPWQISFHPTYVFPVGDFADVADEGHGFMLDLGYRFHPNFSLIGMYGFSRFPYAGDEYTTIHNFSLDFRARTLAGIFSVYAQGGGGFYHVFKKWKPGFNLGSGVVYPVTASFEIDGGVNYHTIFADAHDESDKGLKFVQLHLGFVWRFEW